MSSHETCPYRKLPDRQRWDLAFNADRLLHFDPYEGQSARFTFTQDDKIVTAGSCFAQNIARRLRQFNYGYLMAEYDPALSPEENDARRNTMFSARYGNIYTVAHLYQLIERAYGRWAPEEEYWLAGGRFFDPFRPSVDPNGFATLEELRQSREMHLRAVRKAFESCDVFIFTLGLTEGWINKADSAAYPVCPGCGFGTFDPAKYEFKNYTPAEIGDSLHRAISALREVNPEVKIVLTVSPVPLAATMEPRHILLSTSYSKSVLRVACENATATFPAVEYFGAFEIVNWGREMSSYFEGDLRTVSNDGIDHVMWIFFRYYGQRELEHPLPSTRKSSAADTAVPTGPDREKMPCDDDLLLNLGSNSVKIGGGAPSPKARDPDQEFEAAAKAGAQGFAAKKFEATAQRSPHPFTGWKGVPRTKVWSGRTLDDLGFYNSRNIADFMNPPYRRICVLGPSIVMDLANEEPDTICGRMQREFKRRGYKHVFVYNCGIHASGTTMDLSNLLHNVSDCDPDVIVALSGGLDLSAQVTGDPRHGYPQSFFLWEKILQSFRVDLRKGQTVAYLEDFEYDLPAMRERAEYLSEKWFHAGLRHYEEQIFKMRALSRGFDFGCHVVNVPTQWSYRQNHADIPYDARGLRWNAEARTAFFQDQLPSLHETNSFMSSNLADLMDQHEISEIFTNDLHMTAEGYQLLATKIVDDLLVGFPDRVTSR